jgi:hypothetical protein
MKSNQYEIKIATERVQNAYDYPNNIELNMKNSDFIDDFQVFQTWLFEKYAGENIMVTVQVLK